MNAITYTNTATNFDHFDRDPHVNYSFGYAYETDTHFIHFYGTANFGIIARRMVTQIKNGSLTDWVERLFGASNITPMSQTPGATVEGVWRPAFDDVQHIFSALNVTDTERRLTNQAIRILLDRLEELFLFIEPDETGLATYSFKTRELLILACTEVENFWKLYMDKSNFREPAGRYTTRHYVALAEKLLLKYYRFKVRTYVEIPALEPFLGWNAANPTTSLPWYDGYNKAKHDRTNSLSEATLLNCLHAVVANLVMSCVRFGPEVLFDDFNSLSMMINQHFTMELVNPPRETFYLYKVDIPIELGPDIRSIDPIANGFARSFLTTPLIL